MRTKLIVAIVAALLVGLSCFAGSASATGSVATECQVTGKILMSPGLTETPTKQRVEVQKGKLTRCAGDETFAAKARYLMAEVTSAPVTCSALTGGAPTEGVFQPEGEGSTTFYSQLAEWHPHGGANHGTYVEAPLPLIAGPAVASGVITYEAFEDYRGDTVELSVAESWKHATTCATRPVTQGSLKGTLTVYH